MATSRLPAFLPHFEMALADNNVSPMHFLKLPKMSDDPSPSLMFWGGSQINARSNNVTYSFLVNSDLNAHYLFAQPDIIHVLKDSYDAAAAL